MLNFLIYYIDDQTYEIANSIYNNIKENVKSYIENKNGKEKILKTPLFTYNLKAIRPYNIGLKPDVIICPDKQKLNQEHISILMCNYNFGYTIIYNYKLQDGEIIYGKNYN